MQQHIQVQVAVVMVICSRIPFIHQELGRYEIALCLSTLLDGSRLPAVSGLLTAGPHPTWLALCCE